MTFPPEPRYQNLMSTHEGEPLVHEDRDSVTFDGEDMETAGAGVIPERIEVGPPEMVPINLLDSTGGARPKLRPRTSRVSIQTMPKRRGRPPKNPVS